MGPANEFLRNPYRLTKRSAMVSFPDPRTPNRTITPVFAVADWRAEAERPSLIEATTVHGVPVKDKPYGGVSVDSVTVNKAVYVADALS